jgi:multicomponent Na+:H+ antiporter subunit D
MVGAAQADQMPFVIVLMLSSLLSAGYLIPVVARAFFRAPTEPRAAGAQATETGIGEAPLFCVVPLCLTAAGTVVLFFFADRVTFLLRPILQP